MMLKRFRKYLTEECAFKTGQKVVVALSGGADSMVLLHLLKIAGVRMVAAHCNFNLRGDESDGDERFVVDACRILEIPLRVKSFDTMVYSQQNGVSIEMAARELRYSWFRELLVEEGCDWVATGHHREDSVETFFLNLIRGTGVKGVSGIKPISGHVIRPMLGFSRAEVEHYCDKNDISYCTDSTNRESVYFRNKIRNEILPLFKEMNPAFQDTMVQNMGRMRQVSDYLQKDVARIKEEVVVEDNGQLLISLKHINLWHDVGLVLFEILQPYGFNASVVDDVGNAIAQGVAGKQFYSKTHRLIKDRFNLILIPTGESEEEKEFYISEGETRVEKPAVLEMDLNIDKEGYRIVKDKDVAQFDADLLEYPLVLRKWKKGDVFRPLGMKNFKKLSDFFIDAKFSLKDKEDAWLMLSGNNIIWIIGHRTDDRYKLSDKTKRVVKITRKH